MRRRVILCLVLVLTTSATAAQNRRVAESPVAEGPKNAPAEVDVRRLQAIALLETLAGEVSKVEAVPDRVRLLAEVADAFWEVDKENARSLFRRSLEETNQISGDSPASSERAYETRRALQRSVLAAVARRDPTLANALLREAPAVNQGPEQKARETYGSGSPQAEALMALAQEMLDSDQKQAVALAFLAVESAGITQSFRLFLTRLRWKDRAAADLLFEAAFREAAGRTPGRLFDVLTLWDYAYQPPIFALGGVSWTRSVSAPRFDVPIAIRRKVLAFAVTALGNNARQLVNADAADAGRQVQASLVYSVTKQVMPSVAADLPDATGAVQATLSGLEQDLRGAGRQLPAPPTPDAQGATSADEVEGLLERASAAADYGSRDNLYMMAAYKLLQSKQYERAAEVAWKISDAKRRETISDPISFNMGGELIEKEDYEGAARSIGRIQALSPRVTLLARVGEKLFVKGDTARAVQYLNEALMMLDKAEPSAEASSAALSVASAFAPYDSQRSFEVLRTAINLTNRISDDEALWELLHPVGKRVPLSLYNYRLKNAADGGLDWFKPAYPMAGGLAQALTQVSRQDFDRALSVAKEIRLKPLSMTAQVAICRDAIEQSSHPKGRDASATPRRAEN